MTAFNSFSTLTRIRLSRLLAALALLAISSALIPPAYAGIFLTNAPMNFLRRAHTATLLLDGRVLVAGGDSGAGGYLGSAELFDPAAGTWLPTGSMTNITGFSTNTPSNTRAFHTATLLPNGQVLVAGGVGIAVLASAQLYDPASGVWTETGFMNTARFQHAATLLPDGKVLVTGGKDAFGNSSASAEVYDPVTGAWSEVGPMNSIRWRHTATLLANGKVLVTAGGALISGLSFNLLSSSELYDPATGSWTTSGALHVARFEHAAVSLAGGQMLAIGGFDGATSISSTELYDPASGTWINKNTLTVPRDTPQATLLPDGKVLVTGGYDTNSGGTYFSSAEIYNPALGTWTPNGQMHDRRWQHTATLLADGRVLLAGGFDGSVILPTTDIYDSGTRTTNGAIKVTLSPSNAIALNAKWMVDNGPVQNSGAVVTNLSGGNHVVSFTSIPGWVTPADQIVTVVSATPLTNTVSGIYELNPGTLRVTINPPAAVTDGAEWRADNQAFQSNGVTINLSVGAHTVSFKTIAGWFAPGNQTVVIASATANNLAGTYSLSSGALRVTLNPPGAVAAGAMWQVDNGVFQTNGAVVTGLSAGNHALSFNTVLGWNTPGSQTVTISANATNSTVGDYTSAAIPTGALSVSINPVAAVSAGAWWRADAGPWQNSGAVLSGLGVSNHLVSFFSIPGWMTPSSQTIAVAVNATNTTTGTYILGEKIKPTLTFTAPASNQRVSTSVFTVSGTAKDNVRVAAVFYQLNNNPWTAAATANNFASWTGANLVLVPGTNTLRAYAVDTSNNSSTTNPVRFVYVLSDRLGITFNGPGTISPNYSNALLEIGKNYSMTATAAKGFTFSNWTGSATSTGAKLTFNMQSNLNFTVTFRDSTRPVNSFKTPTNNKRLSNDLFSATGFAKDNVRVSNVWYQLNNDGWSNALTFNSWTNWTATNLVLSPGTNILQAYAEDFAGNHSLTQTVKFIYVLTDRLFVNFNGKGTLSPNYSNAVLEIGKNYSMTAKAATGFRFINWTGSLATASSKLNFNMQSNLTFFANFLDTQPPLLIITNPTINKKWSNAVFTASGKASDNVAVSNVWYQLNGGAWNLATLAANRIGWATPNLTLLSGSNQIQAFALDAVGNRSFTNRVAFTYKVLPVADWAPDSLNGLLAHVTREDTNATENIGFDVVTFAETGVDTNSANYGVGDYLYNKTGTNTAQLGVTFTAPPNATNQQTQVSLVFTNHYGGYFTNDTGGDSGGISFVIVSNFFPGLVAGKTLLVTNTGSTVGNAIKFVSSVSFTSTGNGGPQAGNYTYTRFSPVSGLLTLSQPGQVIYTQITFTNAANGTCFANSFDTVGNLLSSNSGKFKLK